MDNKDLPEEIVLPDYNKSILNLSCSILQHYGVKPEHDTLPQADEKLKKNHQHVVVILLDGLGINILEQHLCYKDFLPRNMLTEYSSVFPPTTTASTTTFLSGKSPIEHGWLGWDVYFEQEDKTVTCFTNTLKSSTTVAADYNVARKYLPYENIIEKINKAGQAKANLVFPFGPDAHPDLNDWINTIKKTCHSNEKTFTYAYWENPDHELHIKGTKSNEITKIVEDLNSKLSILCESCPDTLFFITADHGHKDIINNLLTEDYPEINEMLIRETSIEPRAISFFVKPEYVDKFPRIFNDIFGSDYILFTREEVLKNELFGPGFANENLTGIGDYIAAAYGPRTLVQNKNCHQFKSHHAGLSKEEMSIPLICYERENKHWGLKVYYLIIALLIITLGIMIF